jgi:hypothetical protein
MGAPPAFNPTRQQSGNKLWLWLLLIVVAFCVLCIVGIFFMVRAGMNLGKGMMSCALNADLARTAVVAYTMEHGQMPQAATWQDDIAPNYQRLYDKLHAEEGFKEMKDFMGITVAAPGEVLECEFSGGNKTGFAYNSEFAGKTLDEMKMDTRATVIWETLNPTLNANGSPKDRPENHDALKVMGDKRTWIDFPFEGKGDMFESGDADFEFDLRPEDGLPPGWTGAPNPTGA